MSKEFDIHSLQINFQLAKSIDCIPDDPESVLCDNCIPPDHVTGDNKDRHEDNLSRLHGCWYNGVYYP